MDDDDIRDFIEAIMKINPAATDYCEALLVAMESVNRYPIDGDGRVEVRYFGEVAGGTFYADTEFDHTRWFPDTTPIEALGSLRAEFGDDWTDGLSNFMIEAGN